MLNANCTERLSLPDNIVAGYQKAYMMAVDCFGNCWLTLVHLVQSTTPRSTSALIDCRRFVVSYGALQTETKTKTK